ncbi:otoferlin-like isoform X3 [Patiria miniata]|uniref:C2 domain-containing protein n=1 Tax=Patiria miniata TaxID=46514 RepID=A0A913ZZU7_PATMI|nr:otoferlin-like isoform X3 [Patiria miniata]
MSLHFQLKSAQGFRARAERVAKISFRGVNQTTAVIENHGDEVIWEEGFEWQLGSAIEDHEAIEVGVYNFNKILNNKLFGSFKMILQQLAHEPHISISEPLLDANNTATGITINFEIHYQPPDGTAGDWMLENFSQKRSRSQQNLLFDDDDIDYRGGRQFGSQTSLNTIATTKSSKSVIGSVMKFRHGKKKKKNNFGNLLGMDNPQFGMDFLDGASGLLGIKDDEAASETSGKSDEDDDDHIPALRKVRPMMGLEASFKSQDYQISVTIHEARQLAGLDIDPVICIEVGDKKKYTSVKQSTNCPFYNELFVFDFHDPRQMVFDKIIKLSAMHSRNLLRSGTVIGSFKFDVGTVYRAQDHGFYRKWAILTDLQDINGGVKGYLKVDINCLAKGDSVKPPKKASEKDDDVEANLLLPDNIPRVRQRATYTVRIFKAEGLPIMNSGLLANVKKAFTGAFNDLVDPYVKVGFGGQAGKTSVKKHCYEPKWNEQIVFSEMFPPLCSRMIVQLRDKDSVVDDIVGTHFIDMTKISYEGNEGFLPTFGPSWVNLYGSKREYNTVDKTRKLNEGFGEGCMYRGKLLMSLKTEVQDGSLESGGIRVDVEPTLPISEGAAGRKDDFFFFATIFEANMIDKSAADKPVTFEFSIGNYGNQLDGRNLHARVAVDSDEEEQQLLPSTEEPEQSLSTVPPIQPLSSDKTYYYLPLGENKPCVYLKFNTEEHRRRLYNQNILLKIAEKLDDSLAEVLEKIAKEKGNPGKMLKAALRDFNYGLGNYAKVTKGAGTAGKTKLDKERHKWILREMTQLSTRVQELLATLSQAADTPTQQKAPPSPSPRKGKGGASEPSLIKPSHKGRRRRIKLRNRKMSRAGLKVLEEEIAKQAKRLNVMPRKELSPRALKEKVKAAKMFLHRIRFLADEPQHSIPDVIIWMVSNGKRIAYTRIPARKLLHSALEEERGEQCGEMQTLFLKLPGKKGVQGVSGWTIQAKLDVYMWFGLVKHKKEMLKGLPAGYQATKELKQAIKMAGTPPPFITYKDKTHFMLRCHIYQARSLIGSDSSGLSDPFARVIFGSESRSTRVIEETLSPTWNEVLIFDQVTIYGKHKDLKKNPPFICVEIFDIDIGLNPMKKIQGGAEFIGRSLVHPYVKCLDDPYTKPMFPPLLQWHSIYRGQATAGEMLAAIEMIQLTPTGGIPSDVIKIEIPPIDPKSKDKLPPKIELPLEIRPKMCKYRIEVLFWGVREMKRLQLMTVDKPRCDIQCGGLTLNSAIIYNAGRNPNFPDNVRFMEVDLPENEHYCPPLTIRVVDCRQFGRFSLVGTHTVSNLASYKMDPKKLESQSHTLPSAVIAVMDFGKKPEPQAGSMLGSTLLPGLKLNGNGLALMGNGGQNGKPGSRVPSRAPSRVPSRAPSRAQSRAGSKAGSKAGSVVGEDIIINVEPPAGGNGTAPQPGQTVIDMPADGSKPDETKPPEGGEKVELGPDGQPKGEATGGPPVEGIQTDKPEEPDESTLDWWSRYFQSKLELEKELNELEARNQGATEVNPDMEEEHEENRAEQMDEPAEADVPPGGDPKKKEKDKKKEKPKEEKSGPSKMSKFKGGLNKLRKKDDDEISLMANMFDEEDKDNIDCVTFQIFLTELENVHDFHGFKEWLHTFDLYRGKNTGDDDGDSRLVGKFKGALKLYKWPLPSEWDDVGVRIDSNSGFLQGLPSSEPKGVMVRVYIIKAMDLHPTDVNGKADPYVVVQIGKHKMNDKENYISKNLNPVFGKCAEFEVTFPLESKLTVQVYDWDLIGSDDLIGETVIDLENRYHSRHRATCGISKEFAIYGYNNWRDPEKPTQVLAQRCRQLKLDGPHYSKGRVVVGNQEFTTSECFIEDESGVKKPTDEHVALEALKHFDKIEKVGCRLVPEHIETRSIYHPDKPGIEQGRVEMWVDMFPMDMPMPGAPVDISPRKPKKYELRVIIWNTDDVVLEDDAFFTGEKSSDIFVKGWLVGNQTDCQSTDVHYRSLTGEGNFNWRFLFPFEYLSAEEKMVIRKKESTFSLDETEYKVPPRLNMQVWDADHFSADDFLGSVALNLNRFPRGAKTAKKCSPDLLRTDGTVPQVNIFKMKRIKGWWPFIAKSQLEEEELTGKVEAEITLLTEEEAEKNPAGYARDEPDPLEKPNRPDTSYVWFLNPLKALRYIIWTRFKWTILKILMVVLFIIFLILFFYNVPQFTVKKVFGV